jgi:hypothetical protein
MTFARKHAAKKVYAVFGLFLLFLVVISLLAESSGAVSASVQPVNLGAAGNFAILAETGISTVGASVVGDIGVSPISGTAITGFGLIMDSTGQFATSSLVAGNVYAADYSYPTPSMMVTAISNMQTAYTDAAGMAPSNTELGAGDIGGMTLYPSVYAWSTGLTIPTSVTLDCQGNSSAVFIFQVAQTLSLSNNASVILSGGCQPQNIFWQVGTEATLGTTSVFEGTILAGTEIVVNNGAAVNGRLLAQSAVTLTGATGSVTAPTPSVNPVARIVPMVTISCPPFTAGSSTTCIVTVTGTGSTAPTGTVYLSSQDLGNFAGNPCPLIQSAEDQSQCSLTYTDIEAGNRIMMVGYSGDEVYQAGTGQTFTAVGPSTVPIVTVNVSPSTIDAGNSTTVSADILGLTSDPLPTSYITYVWNTVGSCLDFSNPGNVQSFLYQSTAKGITTNCQFTVSLSDEPGTGNAGSGTSNTLTVVVAAVTTSIAPGTGGGDFTGGAVPVTTTITTTVLPTQSSSNSTTPITAGSVNTTTTSPTTTVVPTTTAVASTGLASGSGTSAPSPTPPASSSNLLLGIILLLVAAILVVLFIYNSFFVNKKRHQ